MVYIYSHGGSKPPPLTMHLDLFCFSSVGFHPACSSRPTHQFNLNYIPASHLSLRLNSMAYIFPPWSIAKGWMLSRAVNRSIRKALTNGGALFHWVKGWDDSPLIIKQKSVNKYEGVEHFWDCKGKVESKRGRDSMTRGSLTDESAVTALGRYPHRLCLLTTREHLCMHRCLLLL